MVLPFVFSVERFRPSGNRYRLLLLGLGPSTGVRSGRRHRLVCSAEGGQSIRAHDFAGAAPNRVPTVGTERTARWLHYSQVDPTDQPAALQVPETQFVRVVVGREQAMAVGRDGQPSDQRGMADQSVDLSTRVQIPDPDCSVPATRDGVMPVGQQDRICDKAGVPAAATKLVARLGVPEDQAGLAPGKHTMAIRRDRQAHDPPRVSLELADLAPCFDVPDTHRGVRSVVPVIFSAAGGVSQAAVGREGHTENPSGMSPELAVDLTGFEIPEPDEFVLVGGECAMAVGREGHAYGPIIVAAESPDQAA